MIAYFKQILIGQFEAALAMMKQSIEACPADHWNGKIANVTFRQVAYHALFCTDMYLSINEDAFSLRDFHERGGDERSETVSPGLPQDETLAYAEICRAKGERGETYQLLTTNDKGHGRIERREYVVVRDLSKIRDRDLWPDLRSLAMVCSERTIDGQTSTEARYYISSCSGSVRQIAGAIRGHWGIENSLHWTLDVTFGEDAHCLRKDHGPENMATFRRAALSLVKQERVEKGSLRRKRLRAGWNNAYLEKLLKCGS